MTIREHILRSTYCPRGGRSPITGVMLSGWLTMAVLLGGGPPNFIIVMTDDQGWGDCGYTGHPHIKTPALDAMARSGIRFD